ncbi:MAG TPA: hypothetical protein VGH80_15285 [Xanthomonadaceae bacterium]
MPHLEALLLLRDQPTAWMPKELAHRLYVDTMTASVLVQHLSAAGLLICEGEACRYAPNDPAVALTIDALASLYTRQTVAIAKLIHSVSDRRAQSFADAFLLPKDR